MFESLMEMMEPELQLRDERIRRESMEEGIEKGMEKGIRGMVGALREFGIGDAQIKAAIMGFLMERQGNIYKQFECYEQEN